MATDRGPETTQGGLPLKRGADGETDVAPTLHQSRVHELKTWPAFFAAIRDGDKNFEVRRNDRGFQRGDVLRLREFDPGGRYHTERYTGNDEWRTITYVLTGEEFGINDGYCVLGLSEEVTEDD